MDYETTVDVNVPEVPEVDTQAADVPAVGSDEPAVEEVSAASFLEDQGETVDTPADDEQKPKITNQKDFDTALNKRLSAENNKGYNRARNEMMNSPEMQYLNAILDDRAAEKGITREQALAELNSERIKAKAQAYNANPELMYMDMMMGRMPNMQAQQQPSTGYASVNEIAAQMAEAIRSNEIPEGFDVQHPDNDFFESASQFGVKAALRIWKAEHAGQLKAQDIANELQRRQKAPKPMSPSSANPATPAPPNYAEMSSEQFRKIEEQIKRAAMNGKRVRLD